MGIVKSPKTCTEYLVGLIADSLVETAIIVDDQATWLGPAMEWCDSTIELVERTGNITLYDGSAGIALACSAVGKALHHEELLQLSVRAARHAIANADRAQTIGLYDGLSGIGLAALAVGQQMNDVDLTHSAVAVLERISDNLTDQPDLISGLAGVALAFVRAAQLTEQGRWIEVACSASKRLVDCADRRPWGWAWTSDEDDPGLCGLAHGSAGPAWILAEVATVSGQPELYEHAIERARQFERSWFDPRTNSWPDLRPSEHTKLEHEPARPAFWCHGSVGIGVSRLAIDACRPHPALKAEVAAALQYSCAAAVDQLRGSSLDHGFTICHGLAGTVDFLLDAYLHFDEATHLETAKWLTDKAVSLLGEDIYSWPGGIQGRPGPGLMNGHAGAMMVLARLAEPNAVPSIVRLSLT
jgi:lantibiotic modifying enzyme